MKVPKIKNGMTNYSNIMKRNCNFCSTQKVTQPVNNKIFRSTEQASDVDIVQEILSFYAKTKQNEILRENEKFLEDLKAPISKLHFNIYPSL